MFPCTVSQLAEIISGERADDSAAESSVSSVTGGSIDSRAVVPGDVFFALPGANSHGILFADDAVARGAACVVTEVTSAARLNRPFVARFQPADTIETDSLIIRVRDTIAALQQLARWNRRQSSALVVGITGSVGKTTTRQMIASVLETQFHGIQSPRNFNNELGVPLSLLRLSAEHDFAVLELGAGRKNEIARLAELAAPELAVVTRVAPSHLESFGSLDAIRQAKQELVEAVGDSGTVFLNADDPAVRSMAAHTCAEIVLFGLAEDSQVRATNLTVNDGHCTFSVDGSRFSFAGPRHLLTSALAAVAVGRITGVADSRIAEGLAAFQLDAGRGRIVMQTPWSVVDDSYNASPASVLGAIGSLADWPRCRHRILVLGDMLELGQEAAAAHFEIGRTLMSSAVDHTLVFGAHAESVVAGAKSIGLSMNRISMFRDLSTLQTILDCLLTPGDVVLVKGSRGLQMERVVQWLQEQASGSQQRTAA